MISEWNDFYIAAVGASAALTGLIFVGVSISLAKILSLPALPERAMVAIFLLLAILTDSMLLLIPGHTNACCGYEQTVFGGVVWIVMTIMDSRIYHLKKNKFQRFYTINILFNQIAVLSYLIGGLCLLYGRETGYYWIAAAILVSFIKAVSDAWVLLVEIHR